MTSYVHLLWAEIKDGRYPPQFVAAYSDGLIDSMVEEYDERRAADEEWYSGFDGREEIVQFFTTVIEVERPTPPSAGATSDDREQPS